MCKYLLLGFIAGLIVGGILTGGIYLIHTREKRNKVYGEQIELICSELSCKRVKNFATFCSYDCIGNITYTFNGTTYYVTEYYKDVVEKPLLNQRKKYYVNNNGKILPKEDQHVSGAVTLFIFAGLLTPIFITIGIAMYTSKNRESILSQNRSNAAAQHRAIVAAQNRSIQNRESILSQNRSNAAAQHRAIVAAQNRSIQNRNRSNSYSYNYNTNNSTKPMTKPNITNNLRSSSTPPMEYDYYYVSHNI